MADYITRKTFKNNDFLLLLLYFQEIWPPYESTESFIFTRLFITEETHSPSHDAFKKDIIGSDGSLIFDVQKRN